MRRVGGVATIQSSSFTKRGSGFSTSQAHLKLVHVLGFPADGDEGVIRQLLNNYKKVLDVTREEIVGFPGVLNGVFAVRLEMHKIVPNLMMLRDIMIQLVYESVIRICRRCCQTGHHAGQVHCSAKPVSGVTDDRQAAPRDAEGSTKPQPEPMSERAPGREQQEAGSKSAEAGTLPTVEATAEPSSASSAGAPGTSPADAHAAEDEDDNTMNWSQDLCGSEWDPVKAGVAERFRKWGKSGPRVTAAINFMRKEYRVLLQRRWDRLRDTARVEE
ncbi:hypothetical protein MRX96_059466 [Rhipicephalus microplus]